MPEYVIDVANIEQLQMIKDIDELDRIFGRAKSTIVQGGEVVLGRKNRANKIERFDSISTEEDIETYRQSVYKYLDT